MVYLFISGIFIYLYEASHTYMCVHTRIPVPVYRSRYSVYSTRVILK
jgi:hypothetical protein